MTVEKKVNWFSRHKKLSITLIAIFSVLFALIATYFIVVAVGKSSIKNKNKKEHVVLPTIDGTELPDDADAYYNDKAYNYNKDLINILVLGVDKNNLTVTGRHQADALYLVSFDEKTSFTNIVAISRNTETKIDLYDVNDNYFGEDKAQICLSYSFGNDDKTASSHTVSAVSKFLYGIPINGYYTIFMNSVKDIVDAVGGVPVHIESDLTAYSPKMTAGTDVIIKGSEALGYLRYRTDSSDERLMRQKQFVSSFLNVAKSETLKNLSLPLNLYNKLAKNTISDVSSASAVYLASEAAKANFKLHSIKGTVGFDGQFETFEVDEESLYSLILDVFYKEII